jgi:hypothetical protein
LQIAEIEWDENQWPLIDEKALKDYRSVLVNNARLVGLPR